MTRQANKLTELMSIHEDGEIVKQATAELRETVKEFQQAHEDYHSQIETVKEIKESSPYHNSVYELVSKLEAKIEVWLVQPISSELSKNGYILQIHPKDSISQIGSGCKSLQRLKN